MVFYYLHSLIYTSLEDEIMVRETFKNILVAGVDLWPYPISPHLKYR